MIPKEFIGWAEKEYKEELDKIDIEHEYDSSLTVSENQEEFKTKFNGSLTNLKEQVLLQKELEEHDNCKPKDKDIEFIELLCNKSLIITVLGARGQGKTCLGFYLLEQLKSLSKRIICTVGFPEKTPYENFDNIETVPTDSICLIDEGSIKFDCRRSLSKENISMSNILKLARHNNITVILISQSSADVDVRTLRMTDVFLLKAPSLVQTYLERSFIKRLYAHIARIFEDDNDHIPYYYVFSDKLQGLFNFSVPSFWSDNISKAHKQESKVICDLFSKVKKKDLNTVSSHLLMSNSKVKEVKNERRNGIV